MKETHEFRTHETQEGSIRKSTYTALEIDRTAAELFQLLPDLDFDTGRTYAQRCIDDHNDPSQEVRELLLADIATDRIVRGIAKCIDQDFHSLRAAVRYETISFDRATGDAYPTGDDPDLDHAIDSATGESL
jgi:hypothetical protein